MRMRPFPSMLSFEGSAALSPDAVGTESKDQGGVLVSRTCCWGIISLSLQLLSLPDRLYADRQR